MNRLASIRGARNVFLIVSILVAGHTVRADGPWNDKPSANWDRGDVRRILFDSPWVRHFTRTKRALEFEVPDQGPSGMELRGYHAKESKEDGAETAEFYVRWVSSRTLRAASARRLALLSASRANPPDLTPPKVLDEFQIAIAGPDLTGFDGLREATLKSKCYLWLSSRRKIAPSHVEFARSSSGKVRGVLFRFPRTTSNGEPLISTHDAKVWFIEFAGGVGIRVTFNLRTMIDSIGPDL